MNQRVAKKILIAVMAITSIVPYSRAIELPDFVSTNAIAHYPDLHSKRTHFFLKQSGIQVLNTFKTIYKSSRSKPAGNNQIPKIIHQIWLGSELPVKYHHFQDLLKKFHPTWQYKLWRDADIAEFKLVNQAAYNEAINFGEKSDIARYEILEREGGIYFDTDVQCLQPFDFLTERYDFFAALEPLPKNSMTCLSLANAIIGSRPGHPLLKECIKQIKNPPIATAGWHPILKTVVKTGPVLLTRAAYQHRNSLLNKGMILPSECFTPANSNSVNKNDSYRFCIHHWDHSWMKKALNSLEV
ncbi:hypothetical protein H0X48_03025 [Candidatus Dependentiae bacterium]|nr:hypothetical protein [Candidatus Dependentiae bacterium]